MAIPTEKPSYGPLDGVKVVYAAVELACPKAADLMADWGADVVWLENTGAGDTIRDTAYVKQAERRNQRSVALNYFSEEGKKVFFDLVKDADIFMEASKGGTWARKGITDDVLWELNPKMVIVHVSGFGQEGDPKMVKRAAYDLTVMAYSGIIMQNGTEEQPMLPGPYAGDYFNTLMIASSALAALYKAEKSGKGESIENQIELCRQYIAMHFGEDASENVLVYEDEGFSGGNLERPQFKKMMKDSQKIAFAAIVVYRFDRISRNIGDFAKLIEDLGDRHIDFISIREQFDTSYPMGRAMMYIASVFSQLERETIAERIRDNMHELSKTGRWLGGTTPTGYASESLSSVTVDGKVKKACKLKPIPEEIQLVKTIFSVFMETGSLSKTDQYLLEHRCVTKRGKQFTRFAIRGYSDQSGLHDRR